MSKYKSRKFIIACVQLVITIVLPVVYRLLDIPSDITMVCLTASAGLTGIYLGANVMAKGKVE